MTLATLDALSPHATAIQVAADPGEHDPWFATERNLEIELSMWLYQRQHTLAFIAARNAEIDTAMAASEKRRASEFIAARNAEIETAMALGEERRTAEFAAARNAEIEGSLALADFTAARNREIAASLASTDRRREMAFAAARNREIDRAMAATERRQLAEFAAARNSEIESSLALADFTAARNREIVASLAASDRRREMAFAADRNREIDIAMAATERRQLADFTAARNAEIEASIAVAEGRRMSEFAAARNLEIDVLAAAAAIGHRPGIIITGTLASPAAPAIATHAKTTRTPGAEACLAMGSSLAAVRFTPGRSTVSADGRVALDEVARLAATCASVEIDIHGHSDAAGSERANQRLSEQRARAVARYLIAAGIDQRRLRTIGHGAGKPIASNDTAENRALNRRIEFSLRERPDVPSLSSLLGSM